MKSLLIILAYVLSTSSYSQTCKLQKGCQLQNGVVITALDSNDTYFWVGTEKGLLRVSKKRNKCVFFSLSGTGFEKNYVTSLFCLPDGCVWIGTNHGLLKYDNYGFILYTNENTNLPENFITQVAVTKTDELLIGTAHHGELRMYRSNFYPTLNNFKRRSEDIKELANTGRKNKGEMTQ